MPISETSVFLAACDVYRAAVAVAVTEIRILNDHLRAHALRILEHVSTAEVAQDRRGRAHSLHYARLSKAKLRAVVTAAFIDKQIDDEARQVLSALLVHLEDEIQRFLWPPKPTSPGSGSAPPQGGAAPIVETPPPLDASPVASANTPSADASIDAGYADSSTNGPAADASTDRPTAGSSTESSFDASSNASSDPASDAAPVDQIVIADEVPELRPPDAAWVTPANAADSGRIPSG